MGAQRAAWQIAFRAEAAAVTSSDYAQALLDLDKASKKVRHRLVLAAAIKHGYNISILRLSFAAYRLPRRIGIDSTHSREVLATFGITAGSGFATTELRVLLLDVIDNTYSTWSMVKLSLYVGDLTIEASGDSHLVAATVTRATDSFINMLEQD